MCTKEQIFTNIKCNLWGIVNFNQRFHQYLILLVDQKAIFTTRQYTSEFINTVTFPCHSKYVGWGHLLIKFKNRNYEILKHN